ncbi:MAG TPA: ATP-binding cassette domain-containing protein [Thermoleophilaceae bacterium]
MTFDVEPGEFYGIVGPNGSGKSTLLKIVAGIYSADLGLVQVGGRLSPFIELGVGFRPELSARDNVILNGTMLGLSKRQLEERFDDIIAFAELDEFVDVKLKNYSTGMAVRLAFSMAIQVDADVLVLDEVLAVGDVAFQAKCYAEFDRIKGRGTTVLFVSHDMDLVKQHCDRALLLDAGRVHAVGDADEIADRYEALALEEGAPGNRPLALTPPSPPDGSDVPTHSTYKPTAMGADLGELWRLTRVLARIEIRVHYEDSALGYLWSLLRPLALFAVLYLIFSRAVGLADGVRDFPLYLLSAIVLWTFFVEAVSGGLPSLVASQPLLRRMRFPRLAVPLSLVVKALFTLAMNFVVVAVFLAIAEATPRLSWLEVPVLVLLVTILATGLTVWLSTLHVRYRDTLQLWTVAQQLLFYASPIIYVAGRYPDAVERVLALNPLAAIFTQLRHALIDPSAPTAAASVGGTIYLLIPLAIIAGVAGFGFWSFARHAPRISEEL